MAGGVWRGRRRKGGAGKRLLPRHRLMARLVEPERHAGHRAQHRVARRQDAKAVGTIVQAGEAVAAGDQHGRKSVGRESGTPTIAASRRAATPTAVRTARPALARAAKAEPCAPAWARAKAPEHRPRSPP